MSDNLDLFRERIRLLLQSSREKADGVDRGANLINFLKRRGKPPMPEFPPPQSPKSQLPRPRLPKSKFPSILPM